MRRAFAALAALALLGAAPAPAQDTGGVALKALLSSTPAPTLAAYRLFTDDVAQHANTGVTPYALNTPLFSDYAEKSRFLYLPPGKHAAYRPEGAVELPVGATLIKTFAYPADLRRPAEAVRRIETRLLIHRRSGWVALTYVWNDEQTQAVLKRAGKRLDVSFTDAHGQARQVDYHVPNQNQCKECHSLSGRIAPIGVKARNLNGVFAYAEGPENQLAHWTRTGMLMGAPTPDKWPRTAVWDDPAEPLAARGRAYLDGNCGHCHNPKGTASNTGLFLNLEEARPARYGIGKRPVAAGKGSGDLETDLVPGRPDASIIAFRMASTEPGVMMPELGRSIVHDEGLAVVRDYIARMH
ncbi:SO2930 family diheme c-type cytochrome [Phenylobacterium sp.]|uniref:SO2930 family diheme c-type cytochrome n=1 Tax=Phenylobacterium sp. TaxID=1871053 RepID=UPI002C374E9A|nr:SO2930 family diheme c-type cytochrome [Phenylobacterium sp.]HLZ75423.1 SO2930 family diheme c-type cytochrome [Phenylobacterium sp.]